MSISDVVFLTSIEVKFIYLVWLSVATDVASISEIIVFVTVCGTVELKYRVENAVDVSSAVLVTSISESTVFVTFCVVSLVMSISDVCVTVAVVWAVEVAFQYLVESIVANAVLVDVRRTRLVAVSFQYRVTEDVWMAVWVFVTSTVCTTVDVEVTDTVL